MSNDSYGYGLWFLVVINTILLVGFAASFVRPRTSRDWRAMGAFSGFAVALFTEMYGFPLTIYLLAGPLGNRFPNLGFSHAQGHLWNDLIGWRGDPHVSPFHLAAYAAIILGFGMLAAAWRQLYAAQLVGELATEGIYARIRHPQYTGFLLIMIGFLLMWPTIPTLIMFPVLVYVYRRLSASEETEMRARFGDTWHDYAVRTPRFLPRVSGEQGAASGDPARSRSGSHGGGSTTTRHQSPPTPATSSPRHRPRRHPSREPRRGHGAP